jgi:hypothetical protein
MTKNFLGHASEKKTLDAAPPVGRQGNQIDIRLDRMTENFIGVMPIPDMSFDFETLGGQLLFDFAQIFLRFPDYLDLRIRWINPGKGMGIGHSQKGNDRLQFGRQLFYQGKPPDSPKESPIPLPNMLEPVFAEAQGISRHEDLGKKVFIHFKSLKRKCYPLISF